MKHQISSRKRGFTLIETVIAIGVLAVLLTGFMIVFAPAAAGIRRAINVQEADRLASTLEQELVTLRTDAVSTTIATGFDKAYTMIEGAMKSPPEVLFVYQYRGDLKGALRNDKTYAEYKDASAGVSGADYTVVPMVRKQSDSNLEKDLSALVGRVYAVKTKQLVFSNGELVQSTKNVIEDPTPGGATSGEPPMTGSTASGKYPEAVIAFSAEFYELPSSSYSYLKTGGKFNPSKLKNPVFTRNLAVRR